MAIKKKAAKKTVAKKVVKKTVEVAAPEAEASAISTEALTALAEELNEVIKPNPPIAVNNTDTLKAEIEETAPMLVAGDKIGKASAETIEALGLKDSLKDIIVKEDKEVKDKAKAEKGKKVAAAKTAPAKKEKKPTGKTGGWREGSLCQTIYLAGKGKKPVLTADIVAIVKKTEAGKKSGNLAGMVDRILNEATNRGLLKKTEKGFTEV